MLFQMGPDAAVRVAQALPDGFQIGQIECEDGEWRSVFLSPSGLVFVRGRINNSVRGAVGRLVLSIERNEAPQDTRGAV